jgi:hypothetical protein
MTLPVRVTQTLPDDESYPDTMPTELARSTLIAEVVIKNVYWLEKMSMDKATDAPIDDALAWNNVPLMATVQTGQDGHTGQAGQAEQHESQVGGGGGSGQSSDVHLKTGSSTTSSDESPEDASDPYPDELQAQTMDR